MLENAKWIMPPAAVGCAAAEFSKTVTLTKKVKKARVLLTALGTLELYVNGRRVGDEVLAPGWTSYYHRVQVVSYDLLPYLLPGENTLSVFVGRGWAASSIGFAGAKPQYTTHTSMLGEFTFTYADGERLTVVSDESFDVFTGSVLFSEIYDGEEQDLTAERTYVGAAIPDGEKKPRPVLRVGEMVREHERVAPVRLILTPKGERVIDFGQNLAGYPEIRIRGKRGDRISLSCAEVLDREGNFYNENYRSAKSKLTYTLSGGDDVLKPRFTFCGYRYIRLDEYPFETVDLSVFTSVAVYSDMKRTGFFVSGNEKINRLYQNVIWGQRSNFVDVPTDCPQRDERLGWLGDAQVFCRTAAINYDTERFYTKWFGDMALDQKADGSISGIVPALRDLPVISSSAWADAVVICPFEVYLAYGNKRLLKKFFPMMRRWVDYMHAAGPEEFLWIGAAHFGDWLGMDAGEGYYRGATQPDLIASAYFAYSASLLVRAGHILGIDVAEYETLYRKVRSAFRAAFMKDGVPAFYGNEEELSRKFFASEPGAHLLAVTQTTLTLILHFGLCEENEKQKLTTMLVDLIEKNGKRLSTGFVGTPYLLHALSSNGETELAYDLLLCEKNPSWLFSVDHGATTMWEHWDGLREDGGFWSRDMNSFNHYAYGAVYDWIYGVALGITVPDEGAGYRAVRIAPHPDRRLGFAEGGIESRHGRIVSSWHIFGDTVRYEITLPEGVTGELTLPNGEKHALSAGTHLFVRPFAQ